MQLTLTGKPIDEVAIDLLRYHEADALRLHPEGYSVAHSGGKDSIVIHDLVKRAGVKHVAVHNVTGIDPPEVVRFIKSLGDVVLNPIEKSMWRLIAEHRMAPLRTVRFCCQGLKERGDDGRLVVTGIRDAESTRRQKRRVYEPCFRQNGKMFLNIIKGWPTDQVWQYIRERGLRYCSLYDEGFLRVGCVLCPMVSNPIEVQRQVERWPRLARAWERAIKAAFCDIQRKHGFRTADDYWDWWLHDRRSASPGADNDPVMFEDNPEVGETAAEVLAKREKEAIRLRDWIRAHD